MAAGDPVPAIAEAEAAGEIAVLFADIRAVLGVPLVNLVWRHLATLPGALGWCWAAARPIYVSGRAAAEAQAVLAGLSAPPLPGLSREALAAVGVGEAELARIRAVVATYNHTNPVALVALTALRLCLAGEPGEVRPAAPVPGPAPAEADLPRLLPLAEMAADTASMVVALNRLGARGHDRILASMYRHLDTSKNPIIDDEASPMRAWPAAQPADWVLWRGLFGLRWRVDAVSGAVSPSGGRGLPLDPVQ
ncbi:MAG: hypothetical protein FJX68_15935 [Alphaproteobacteria bacterium]|nr:hypothetical protein [Alphaproteobacteria bacterium]